VVRGLKPDDFSPEDNVLVFLGISSYIGSTRGRQDEEGNMLMHIRDAKLSKTPQQDRPTRYSSRASVSRPLPAKSRTLLTRLDLPHGHIL
jgi:hypothetical protein